MTTTRWPLTYTVDSGQDFLTGKTYLMGVTYSPAQIMDGVFRDYEQEWKELASL